MLITVDKERGCEPASPPRKREPRQSFGIPTAARGPSRLWVVTAVLTLVSSAIAMSRVTGLGLEFVLGQLGRQAQEKAPDPLPWQLPYGKGMWMWQPDKSDGGDAKAIVSRAKHVGLTHIYVRTGSTWDGFYAGPFLDQLLPVAHEAGIRVYGWDFPRLIDPAADVARALEAINYVTPDNHRIDGFAPDIETRSEGTHITPEAAVAYADALRAGVPAGFPLIACVPRPSPWTKAFFPYAELAARFDAVAPMVYWLNRQPDTDVTGALRDLVPLGKPVFPVGQAYDGAPEGGRPGPPPPDELQRFMSAALHEGAMGVSFWSWQAANQQVWDTIRDAPQFRGKVEGLVDAKPSPAAATLQPIVFEAG